MPALISLSPREFREGTGAVDEDRIPIRINGHYAMAWRLAHDLLIEGPDGSARLTRYLNARADGAGPAAELAALAGAGSWEALQHELDALAPHDPPRVLEIRSPRVPRGGVWQRPNAEAELPAPPPDGWLERRLADR